jgi:pyridoxine 4-dehydrogenase
VCLLGDRSAALARLRRLFEIGVNFIAANGIGFIPWYPLAAGTLTRPGGIVDRIAKAHGAMSGQVALAWLLHRSPVVLPIPGTLRVSHLEENAAAAALSLTTDEIGELDADS